MRARIRVEHVHFDVDLALVADAVEAIEPDPDDERALTQVVDGELLD